LAFGAWLISLGGPLDWELEPSRWQRTFLKAPHFPVLRLTDVSGIKFTVAYLRTSRKHSTSIAINVSEALYFSAIVMIVVLWGSSGCNIRTSWEQRTPIVTHT
jgi:hypothetical protein